MVDMRLIWSLLPAGDALIIDGPLRASHRVQRRTCGDDAATPSVGAGGMVERHRWHRGQDECRNSPRRSRQSWTDPSVIGNRHVASPRARDQRRLTSAATAQTAYIAKVPHVRTAGNP